MAHPLAEAQDMIHGAPRWTEEEKRKIRDFKIPHDREMNPHPYYSPNRSKSRRDEWLEGWKSRLLAAIRQG